MTYDVDYWIDELRRQKWTFYFWPNRLHCEVMVASFDWGVTTDVVVILSENYCVAWRAPMSSEDTNPFHPKRVKAFYDGPVNRTLRNVLSLAPPGQEQFPQPAILAPPNCCVPQEFGRDMLMYRPAAGRASVHTSAG